MHVDVFPEFAPPRVVIQTACVGPVHLRRRAARHRARSRPALNGIQGLDDMRSKSVPQLSSIELLFKPGTDLLRARQLVQERLATVSPSLPTWAAPPVMLAPVSATGRAMQIGMTSKNHSLIEMSMTAYWTIRARLLRVPGVANVAIWNERLQLMTVQAEPAKMQAQQVSLDKVMEATADAVDSGLLKFSTGAVIGTGGTIETPNQRIGVRNVLPIVTPADLAKVPGAHRPTAVRLGDVATVAEEHQPLIGDAIIDGQPGLLLVVEKLPWANSLQMTAGVEEAIRQLQPGLPGITFDTKVFQQANFVKLAIANLTQALVIGFILVVVILALFLFEWRMALISLLTIPLSLVATLLVLYWRGATINTMTLAGLVIALGAVVDDAIIDVENITRRLREERLGRRRPVHRVGDPQRLPRGAQPDRLRHAHHRRGVGPRLPAGRADRGVLPAARAVLHARDRRLDGGRAHRHPGAGPADAARRADRAPQVAAGGLAAEGLHRGAVAGSSSGRSRRTPRSPR